MTTVSDELLDTARGPVTALRALPAAGVDTGVPVVLCPGIVGSKEDFAGLLPAFAGAGYRSYAYDYLGHYAPVDPESEAVHTIDRHAEDLLAVLAAVAGDGPVHLVGHSYGGFVARAAAVARPQLLRSLTLIGSGPGMDSDRHRTMLMAFDGKLAVQGAAVMWPVVQRLIPERNVARREFWRSRLDRMRPAFLHGALRSLAAEPDRGGQLRAAGLSVLILYGHRDRRLWTPSDYAGYAERVGAELDVIADASHSPNLEQPAATTEALLRFWTAADRRHAPRSFVDLFRPRAVPDPYPAYTALRTVEPALAVQLPGKTPALVLTRHADCARLLHEPGFVSAGEAPELLAPGWRDNRLVRCLYQSFGWRDGAAHAEVRAEIAHRLAPRRCAVRREDIEEVADRLLDRLAAELAGGATVDLGPALALPFAALVTGRLLDLPDDDALRLGEAARVGSAAFEPFTTPRQRAAMEAAGEMVLDALAALADRSELLSLVRRHHPGGGERYLGDLALLFGAGYDSPASLVTLGARLLLEHPDQAEILRDDPDVAERAVEEILRYDPPVQIAVRIATEPTRFGRHDVAPGTALLGLLGAANRDPEHVVDPDRFLVTRPPSRPSLTFGAGRHYCPGAAIARLHAQVLFPRLVQRFPGLRLAGPPRFRSPGTMLRGIEQLPVRLDQSVN